MKVLLAVDHSEYWVEAIKEVASEQCGIIGS